MSFLSYRTDKSRAIISKMLSLCSNPYLALSFGKDSVVMLDLVREQYPDIPCLFLKSEETFLLGDYEDVIQHYQAQGVNVKVVEMKHQDSNFVNGANNEFQQEEFFNYDGCFMGLRIEESNARRITIVSKANNTIAPRIMRYKNGRRKGMYRACPVADWKSYEIMAWIERKGLRTVNAYQAGHTARSSAQLPYDDYGMLGIALHKVQQQDMEKFNKLLELFPHLQEFKV